jgi:hypothetical protein
MVLTRSRPDLVGKWHQASQEKKLKSEGDTYLANAQYSKGHYPAHSTEWPGDGYVGCGEGGDDGYDERRVGHEQLGGEKTRGRKEKRKAKLCIVESYCVRDGLKECGSTESAGRRRGRDHSRRAAKRRGAKESEKRPARSH